MEKATREAKQQTSWTANNKDFEEALKQLHRCSARFGNAPFLAELEAFVARVLEPGRVNSLAQTLLKHTAPGVPDLYQGSELWDHSLVDPDNRRPVDYDERRRLLAEMKTLSAAQVMARSAEGLPKLWTIHHALTLRREHREWFGADAAYTPLKARGRKRNHVIASLRGDRIATVVPRHPVLLGGAWHDTVLALPEGRWRNRLTNEEITGGTLRLEDLLRGFPVALLVKESRDA